MTDYTKGPWQTVMVGDVNPKTVIATADMVSVLTIAWEDETPFAAVFEEADATLMAAAPELIEAMPDLLPVIAWLSNGCDPLKAVDELKIYQSRIDSAKAKAVGE